MRYLSLLLALCICSSSFAQMNKKLRVLFIGNSLTYVNDLPHIISSMAISTGDTLVYDSYTIGGYRLADHFFDTSCIKKIKSAHWDYIVLQEQSRMPSRETNYFFNSSYTWARNLDTVIQSHDPCTKVLYYMTWGYKDGDTAYCSMYPSWPAVCTYEGMDSIINLHYRYYADTALADTVLGWAPIIGHRNAHIAPAGEVWHYIRHHYPSVELYWSDGVHPSEAGSYAAGCALYTALFRKDPSLISYGFTLDSSTAADLRTAAHIIVFDSISKWKIGTEDLRAQFTWSASGSMALFTNASTTAGTYSWDFGDGGSSILNSPTHFYTTGGTYTVRLIADDGSCTDTSYGLITVAPSGITDPATQPFIISPNPTFGFLTLQSQTPLSGTCNIRITDISGKAVYTGETSTSSTIIDISYLKSGTYFISVSDTEAVVYRSLFIKQ